MMPDLHRAAYNADADALAEILCRSRLDVDRRDSSGYTALLWSCLRGAVGDPVPVALALLAAGADPNLPTADGTDTPLTLAVQSGNPDLVELLLDRGAHVNLCADGVTALMTAARCGNATLVRALLRRGADAGMACGSFTAADYAWRHGHDALAEELRSR